MTKLELLKAYRTIYSKVLADSKTADTKQHGKLSNKMHNDILSIFNDKFIASNASFHQLMMNHYCYLVSMLETRHRLRPYSDIEFSRRVGEVWEKFCKVSLDNPDSKISKSNPIEISEFYKRLSIDMNDNSTFEFVKDLLGDIDLTLDYFGNTQRNEFIGIDFKSGFGSNEKGNTQRILQVGKIYHQIAPEVKLKLVIRQDDNNNYLSKIEKSGVWDVVKGKDAYSYLTLISGCDILSFVENEVDFEQDISDAVYKDLNSKIQNRDRYLHW